jgi:integrase
VLAPLQEDCRDALLRRVKALCLEAKVPIVVAHSMRGLHATLATDAGITGHAVAANLGHTTFVVTARHYVAPATVATAASRRTRGALRAKTSTVTAVTHNAPKFTAAENEETVPEDRDRETKKIA